MKKSFLYLFCVSIILLSAVARGGADNNGNGSSPNGKPFIAIDGQIVEVTGLVSDLQDQLDALVGRVESLEERLSADEGAIAMLENNNAALEALINTNATDIESIESIIGGLQADLNLQQSQLASATGDLSTLEQDITEIEALIASLNSAILMIQDGYMLGDQNLQSQIDNNAVLISALQSEINMINNILAMKQDILNGNCPEGSTLVGFEDGVMTCDNTPAGAIGIETTTVYGTAIVPAATRVELTAPCPSYEYMVTGGGGSFLTGLSTSMPVDLGGSSGPNGVTSNTGWRVANNFGILDLDLFIYARCLKLTFPTN